jgi:hypothetical protein
MLLSYSIEQTYDIPLSIITWYNGKLRYMNSREGQLSKTKCVHKAAGDSTNEQTGIEMKSLNLGRHLRLHSGGVISIGPTIIV